MDHAQLSQGNVLDIGRKLSVSPAGPDQFAFGICKTPDHYKV
jgi:hypothetical protein